MDAMALKTVLEYSRGRPSRNASAAMTHTALTGVLVCTLSAWNTLERGTPPGLRHRPEHPEQATTCQHLRHAGNLMRHRTPLWYIKQGNFFWLPTCNKPTKRAEPPSQAKTWNGSEHVLSQV